MAFQVDITEPALADAEDYVRFIRHVRQEPEIRHLIYFSHRIIFRVEREKRRVVIHCVHHTSRQGLAEGDLP